MKSAIATKDADIFAFALAGLGKVAQRSDALDRSLRERLLISAAAAAAPNASLLSGLKAALQNPQPQDLALVDVARMFSLTLVEVLCARLAMAAEQDIEIGHGIAQLQAPLASHRPTVGLLADAFGEALGVHAVQVIGHGAAVRHGILRLNGEDSPLPERQVSVPLPMCLALDGVLAPWPGTRPLELDTDVPLGSETDAVISGFARQLSASSEPQVLVVRSGEPLAARAAAWQLCREMESPGYLIETEDFSGLAAWLFCRRVVPIFRLQLAPGDCRPAPRVPAFPGPTIVIAGTDGDLESDGRRLLVWRIPLPTFNQRRELWRRHVPAAVADRLANDHRQSAARIAAIARDAAVRCGPQGITLEALHRATRVPPPGLSALAEHSPEDIDDSALIAPPSLRQDLEQLLDRCRLRDRLVDGFGPALRARYRPGVRALFVGPSGTGKTLAAGWLATRLALPLFRVDLAAVTSKYIGETEKNLSELLSRAEESEIVLLFDEADSLFGKRTEVRDAHDRFANAQTNFLLQRLETYDGIVLLTSNSRTRFDSAFVRRLDAILQFPSPGPEERRSLWRAHLGERNELNPVQLNSISALADFSGGQIRNAVLAAATRAGGCDAIRYEHLIAGIEGEYRKLGSQLPEELRIRPSAP